MKLHAFQLYILHKSSIANKSSNGLNILVPHGDVSLWTSAKGILSRKNIHHFYDIPEHDSNLGLQVTVYLNLADALNRSAFMAE